MKNSLNRNVPNGFKPFVSTTDFMNFKRNCINQVKSNNQEKLITSLSEIFDLLEIRNGMTLSFHHHLRNGDYVLNMVAEEILRRNLKDIVLAPSSIFPNNAILSKLIENGNVVKIYTNYLNGPVAKTICEGKMKDLLIMDTHGGRGRAIESGDIKIDVAFIATPCADKLGNGNGLYGKAACGTLGYVIPDMLYAKKKVVVTDYLVDNVNEKEIIAEYIDYVLKVDQIGAKEGIVSGTTKVTKDPIGLRIAFQAASLLNELGLIKNGFSMQTGAGGVSLAVSSYVKDIMIKNNIKASFGCGGITAYFVEMLESNLIEKLYDVQCFDLEAVRSIRENANHQAISALEYANIYHDPVVNKLDFVILGATEIDVDFNVNVTTSSNGLIIGGSGGHADTAFGAKVTVIVSPLVKTRIPIIKERVTTVTTPGNDVDVLVTERGIAINPKRTDLLAKLSATKLKIVDIKDLLKTAHRMTGIPKEINVSDKVIGVVRYRDQTIIDSLYQIN